ncbi:sulfite oxidase [Sphingomonas oryzagri]
MTPEQRAERNLLIQSRDPLNAEPAPNDLVEHFLTDQSRFYIRSHGDIPDLGQDHAMTIDGLVERPGRFTKSDLEKLFEVRSVTSVMQCAGNRRADLQQVSETSGDPWGVGAIGNADWTGISLADVLRHVGMDLDRARFVRFFAADEVAVEGETTRYGVSIPIGKAVDPDVLVAWAMNGEPLAPEHGAPLRAVVPGYAGVRSAKWLVGIEVSDQPAEEPIQAKDYKLFPSSVAKEEANWDEGLTINEMPINAAICRPGDGDAVQAGPVAFKGYAVAYAREIARVEISIDAGEHWEQADLHKPDDTPWSWTLWSRTADLSAGQYEIVVRAIDEAGQSQPSNPADVWNFAGYLSTSWHRITLSVR